MDLALQGSLYGKISLLEATRLEAGKHYVLFIKYWNSLVKNMDSLASTAKYSQEHPKILPGFEDLQVLLGNKYILRMEKFMKEIERLSPGMTALEEVFRLENEKVLKIIGQ